MEIQTTRYKKSKMKCTLIFISGMAVSMVAMSFFNIPQQMFKASGGIMFPEQTQTSPQAIVCDCKCG